MPPIAHYNSRDLSDKELTEPTSEQIINEHLGEKLPDKVVSNKPSAAYNRTEKFINKFHRFDAYNNTLNVLAKVYRDYYMTPPMKRSFDISCKSIGSMAVVVDPLDDEAISFYEKYGFILLPDSGKMFISMKTIKKLF